MGVLKDLEQVIGRAGAERSLVKPGHYRRVMCLESGSRQNASRREALRQADLPGRRFVRLIFLPRLHPGSLHPGSLLKQRSGPRIFSVWETI